MHSEGRNSEWDFRSFRDRLNCTVVRVRRCTSLCSNILNIRHCVVRTRVRNCSVLGLKTEERGYQMTAAFGQSHHPLYSLGLNETSAFLKQEDWGMGKVVMRDLQKKVWRRFLGHFFFLGGGDGDDL